MATLILNADAQPTNLLPLSVITWQEAIRYLCLEKVKVLTYYEDWWVHSVSWQTQVPAVVMLLEYQKPKRVARLSKKNIYLRDGYRCQYCGISVTEKTASVDHVIPQSQGGRGSWDNLSTACRRCNSTKSDRRDLHPRTPPYKPDYWELAHKRRQIGYDIKHPSWLDFLS